MLKSVFQSYAKHSVTPVVVNEEHLQGDSGEKMLAPAFGQGRAGFFGF